MRRFTQGPGRKISCIRADEDKTYVWMEGFDEIDNIPIWSKLYLKPEELVRVSEMLRQAYMDSQKPPKEPRYALPL